MNDTRSTATWKSFGKMLLYQALLVAAVYVQDAGSWDALDLRVIGPVVGLAVLKAALTWFTTEGK